MNAPESNLDRRAEAAALVDALGQLLSRRVDVSEVAQAILTHTREDVLFVEDEHMDDEEKSAALAEITEIAATDPLLLVVRTIDSSAPINGASWSLYAGARILATLQTNQ